MELLILCSGWICAFFRPLVFGWAVNSFCWVWSGSLGSKKGILKALHDLNISQWLTIFQISTIHGTQYSKWLLLFLAETFEKGIQMDFSCIWGDVTWPHNLTKWIASKHSPQSSRFPVDSEKNASSVHRFYVPIGIRVLVLYPLPTAPDDQPMVKWWLRGLITILGTVSIQTHFIRTS